MKFFLLGILTFNFVDNIFNYADMCFSLMNLNNVLSVAR